MKRILAALLAAALMLIGSTALAEDCRVAEENAASFRALLEDLRSVGNEEGRAAVQADLDAIRAVSEADYEIARRIADHWQAVCANPDYPLCIHDGGQRATALEQIGLTDGDAHAFVVLGYELVNGGMTEELKGRCEAAAAAARSFPGAILVCSGGPTGENNPDRHTEAGLMRDYLVNVCGIDAGRVFIDERAMTTVENAVNSLEILRAQGIETMTIITSDYHQRRGQAIYNAMSALYARDYGYAPAIVGNYCYGTDADEAVFQNDVLIATRQLGQLLNLPREKHN